MKRKVKIVIAILIIGYIFFNAFFSEQFLRSWEVLWIVSYKGG